MVHSDLDHHGFTHALIGFARESGVAAYTGDGSNRWPAANTYDIGVLYRLALEKAPAGSTLHGVGDTGIPRKVIAETIAGKLGVETKSITDEEAPQYLGFLAGFAGLDNPTSNDKTRAAAGLGADAPGLGRGRADGPLLQRDRPPGRLTCAGSTSFVDESSHHQRHVPAWIGGVRPDAVPRAPLRITCRGGRATRAIFRAFWRTSSAWTGPATSLTSAVGQERWACNWRGCSDTSRSWTPTRACWPRPARTSRRRVDSVDFVCATAEDLPALGLSPVRVVTFGQSFHRTDRLVVAETVS